MKKYKITVSKCSNYLKGNLKMKFSHYLVKEETIKNNNHTLVFECDSMTKASFYYMLKYYHSLKIEEIQY